MKRWKRKASALVALIVTLGVFSAAFAQESAQTPEQAVEVKGGEEVNLPPAQLLELARKYLPAMDKGRASVKKQLDEARKLRDVVKTLCLQDKLNEIDLAIKTAQDRVDGLAAAVSQNDADRSRHEFTIIQVLKDRVNTLVAEAQQCIGEETGFIGESHVEVTIDNDLPREDPSDFPEDPLISEPPVTGSPIT
jgi:hypothetical protein